MNNLFQGSFEVSHSSWFARKNWIRHNQKRNPQMGNAAFLFMICTGRCSRLPNNLSWSYNCENSLDHNQKIKHLQCPEIVDGKHSLNVWDKSHIFIPIPGPFLENLHKIQAGSKSQREKEVITRIYRAAYSSDYSLPRGQKYSILSATALLREVEDTCPDGKVTCF